MVVFVQSGRIWVKVAVFGQKWLKSKKSGCIRTKVVVYDKVVFSYQLVVSGRKWLYSGKVAEFGQSACIRVKWLYSDKHCSIRAKVAVFGQKLLCSGKSCCIRAKVVVFGQSGFNRAQVFVFRQSCCTWAKVVVFGQGGCIRAKEVVLGQSC